MLNQNLLPADSRVLVFIGPSGAGKSTVVKLLAEAGLIEITPTWTDRPLRPNEAELEHKFVSSDEFDRLVKQNFFAHEPLQLFGLPYRYAIPLIKTPTSAKVPAFMSRVMAVDLADQIYPNRIIYQIEAPLSKIRARLLQREQSGIELGTRLNNIEKEIQAGRSIADRIFQNDQSLKQLADKIARAIKEDFKQD